MNFIIPNKKGRLGAALLFSIIIQEIQRFSIS